MLWGFLVHGEKGGVENGVDLPVRWNLETEGYTGDDFLNFKGACPLHLEFLGPVHMEVGGLEPDFFSYSPGGELGEYPLLHFLLGYLVGVMVLVDPYPFSSFM